MAIWQAVNVGRKDGYGGADQNQAQSCAFLSLLCALVKSLKLPLPTRIPYGYSSDYCSPGYPGYYQILLRLAEEEDLIPGTADAPDGGISNEHVTGVRRIEGQGNH